MKEDSLRTTFLAHLAGGQSGRPLPEDLDETLRRLVQAGCTAWPDLPLSAPLFLRHLAERLTAADEIEPVLSGVHAADLYLACACTLGVKGAVERFEAAHFASIGAFLHHVDSSTAFADEVRQLLRQKLFVAEADGAPPRIAGYSGRGQLSSWVGVAAQRTGLSLLRDERKHAHDDDALADALPVGSDPELDYLRTRYRADFREAFREAIALLTHRERMILRLHLVSGLSHEKIGAFYQVNQSTASRWIAKARESISREAQRSLRERLNLNTSELHSLAHLVGSHLDLSIARWLGEEHG
jgi:RNA polymerase sigma-70 factor (ECF subfamily)